MHYINTPIRKTTTQDLSSAVLSFTYTMLKDGFFHWGGFKADGTITETATVQFNSIDGAAFDIVWKTTSLSSAANFSYIPNAPIFLKKGDGVTMTCTKGTATETVSATMFFEEVESYG